MNILKQKKKISSQILVNEHFEQYCLLKNYCHFYKILYFFFLVKKSEKLDQLLFEVRCGYMLVLIVVLTAH